MRLGSKAVEDKSSQHLRKSTITWAMSTWRLTNAMPPWLRMAQGLEVASDSRRDKERKELGRKESAEVQVATDVLVPKLLFGNE